MTELRVGWGILGALLLLTCRPLTAPFVLLWLAPWGIGVLLLGSRRAAALPAAIGSALGDGVGRLAVLLLAGSVVAVGVALGAFAALLVVLATALLALTAGMRGSTAPVRNVVTGVALGLTGLVLTAYVLELILDSPRVAARVGTPSARAAWEAAYDSAWRRNAFGYRTPHERIARTPGVARVLALGDSYTWGDKVASSDSTWPALLERALENPASPVEVVNLGERGFTLANEGEQLRRIGWQFAPDLVVWQFFINDAYRSGPGFQRDGEAWVSILPARFREGRAGRSALLYLAERAVNQALRGRDGTAAYASLYARDSPGWKQLDSALAEGADSAKARDVPMVLVLFPAFVPGAWTAESYPLAAYHAQVRDAAEQRGYLVLDLAPVFAEQGGDWRRWWALPWDSHPSAAGHALAATAIGRFVSARGLVPTQP